MTNVKIYQGDCLDVLAEMPDASIDAIITDPPYGLDFMGKKWDTGSVAFDTAIWGHALRVLKPGGHVLAFGGSRTWHRLASAIEDSGFELRDSIAWLYGSGFPKSLDVSKAIDKARDDRDEVRVICRWLRERVANHPTQTVTSIAEAFGFNRRMVDHWMARDTDSQPTLPTVEQWHMLIDLLGLDDSMTPEVYRLNGRKGDFGEDYQAREVTGEVDPWTDRTNYAMTSRDGKRRDTAATDAAIQWQGWGTSLKPAFEPIVVGRKPFKGTVAQNVQAHGTGAINIDACRVAHDEPVKATIRSAPRYSGDTMNGGKRGGEQSTVASADPAGRWPANVVLDAEMADLLDQQSGTLRARGNTSPTNGGGGMYGHGVTTVDHGAGDQGGASRFFPTFRYQAKAPKSERPNVDGVAHPTVKPLALMQWLIKLVAPQGATILDPFAGSGTTIEAALLENVNVIGIEREAEYIPLIKARIERQCIKQGA